MKTTRQDYFLDITYYSCLQSIGCRAPRKMLTSFLKCSLSLIVTISSGIPFYFMYLPQVDNSCIHRMNLLLASTSCIYRIYLPDVTTSCIYRLYLLHMSTRYVYRMYQSHILIHNIYKNIPGNHSDLLFNI